MMPRIVRIYLRAYTSIHAPTVARMCGSAAHLPTIPGGVPLRRSSRCNCVNCTTHMIRIAFNYSPICEILPLPSLRRALYLVSSPCAQRVQRARAMRVRAFDDNERWAKGEGTSRKSATEISKLTRSSDDGARMRFAALIVFISDVYSFLYPTFIKSRILITKRWTMLRYHKTVIVIVIICWFQEILSFTHEY